MKTNNKFSAFALIALATLTSCSSPENDVEQKPITAPATSAATPQNTYIELNGSPHLTEDDLPPEYVQAIAIARQAGHPVYIQGTTVFWLDPSISYAERALVENEALKTYQTPDLRAVEGFGSGELTFYRHKSEPYTLQVKQK